MNRINPAIVLPAAAMLALAACGAGDDEGDSEESASAGSVPTSSESEPEPESPSPTEDPLEAADGIDYESCFDGDCEVRVSAGTEFAIDDEYGMDTFTVTEVGDGYMSVEGTGPGTAVGFSLGVDNQGNANNALVITVVAIEGDEGVLELRPT
ncbi:hypothetical protein [Glycomyces buryatensis]|uniref:Uncharacterized protein n=1 Tax=Glycomyces buryatensis TaxID=2570927 RepID=A0A4S8PZ85_9ACTN|nr:hypothetical protein [Glycomyces buryatensis]THV36980.1 hypothetical protein FAB82_20690 [Glycomyces buryatensis]